MKGKKIEIKDITSSPFFVIGIMVFVCLLIAAMTVTMIMGINTTKQEILDARALYEQNVREIALLEELKIKSEAAEQQLDACKDILPDSLGDVYLLEEEVLAKCRLFGLKVEGITQTVAVNETNEVVFQLSVVGSFETIYNYMNYYSNLEQVHRFDSITLTRVSDEEYKASLSLSFLSAEGSEGAVQAAVNDATE